MNSTITDTNRYGESHTNTYLQLRGKHKNSIIYRRNLQNKKYVSYDFFVFFNNLEICNFLISFKVIGVVEVVKYSETLYT